MIIRHGEKPTGSGGPQDIDVNGNADSHSLAVRGWARAGTLVELFAPSTGSLRDGLARPTAAYAAGGAGTRPRETVTPLAKRLGKKLTTTYVKGSESQLAAEVSRRAEPTLISWQHEEIPALAAAGRTVRRRLGADPGRVRLDTCSGAAAAPGRGQRRADQIACCRS